MIEDLSEMPTTVSFILTVSLLAWINDEAKRLGVSRSEFMRSLVETVRARELAVA